MIGQRLADDGLRERWERWLALVTEMHAEFQVHQNPTIHFTRMAKPLKASRVALLSTGGVHRKTDRPFDLADPAGDPSIRSIPVDVDPADLTVSHMHYDTDMAQRDIDCIFPLRTAQVLHNEGMIGELASVHYGLMGFVPNGQRLIDETGPELAARLVDDGVDVAVLVPG